MLPGREAPLRAADARSGSRARLDAVVELRAARTRRRAQVWDVSARGIGIAAPDLAFAPGSELVLEFALPGIAPALELRGSVVWHERATGRAGLLFGPLDPGVHELLQAFVSGRL